MKKSDLKSGMIVELRGGELYMVMVHIYNLFLCNNEGFTHLKYWNDDLINIYPYSVYNMNVSRDIIKIRIPDNYYMYREIFWYKAPIIWQREEKKTINIFNRSIEFTEDELAELKKQLGE